MSLMIVNPGVQEVRLLDKTSPEGEFLPIAGKGMPDGFPGILECGAGLRNMCAAVKRALQQENEAERPEIRLPIFRPALQAVENHAGREIDRLVLVVTDQDNPQYRKDDTVEFAELLRFILHQKRPSLDVEVVPVADRPHLVRPALTAVRSAIGRILSKRSPTRVYLSCLRGFRPSTIRCFGTASKRWVRNCTATRLLSRPRSGYGMGARISQ